MRKIVLIALCFLVLGSTAFALDMVIGGGGQFGLAFKQYNYPENDDYYATTTNIDGATSFGGFAFFGLTRYMEANISVFAEIGSAVDQWYETGEKVTEPWDYTRSYVGVGFYFKYPFTFGNNFVLFPTLGTDLQSNNGGLDLWLGGGVGMDIFFGQRLFLRAQAVYRYGVLLVYKGALYGEGVTGNAHGPLFKLGLGWMY